MRTIHAIVLLILTSLGSSAQQPTIDIFFRDFTAEWIRANPNQAVATRYFTGAEQERLEGQLTPESGEYRRSRIQLARKGLADLRKFDRSRMSPSQQVSADVMEWQLNTVAQGEAYLDFSFPLEQFGGANVNLVNTLTVNHPLVSEKDAANYISRLRMVEARMNEAASEARRLATKGVFPPRFIIEATITQMRQFTDSPATQNPFVSAFVERMSGIKTMSEAKREELRLEAAKIVGDRIYPAWRDAVTLLETLQGRANDDAGLWRFKDGAEVYAYQLRRFTTTSLTAEQIHQIGLRQVEQIEKEMDAILRRLGRTQGSVKDRVARLRTDLAYPLTEEGRKRIMTDVETMLRDAERRAAIQFDKRPKAPVVAQPYPRFRETNAAASYNAPAPDGSRPGTFQIPLRPERMTKFALRTLVYHETIPGHHFQIALEMENEALPRFRRIRALGGISALSEGWGLYAERLAAESGWYENDLEGQLGQLDAELFRARRLVVDTGLHAKRWKRQQAIDYGIEASEVERYVVNPGQACAYMLGELKIIELRDKARKALGNRFSLKEFHNVVLAAGTVPLEILSREIDDYIRSASR